MLRNLIESGYFYYSHGYDLTNSLQRLALSRENVVDERFQWNKFLLSKFERLLLEQIDRDSLPTISSWMVNMIWGFVSIQCAQMIGGHIIDIALISRRDRHRAGTRFNKRGCNRHGDVANYVETEQILIDRHTATITAYVQVRGSVPLLWEQPTDLHYEPQIQLRTANAHGHITYFRKHFERQLQIYGDILILSLLKTKDHHEGLLSQLYQQHVNMLNSPNVHFVAVDITQEIGYCNKEPLNALHKVFDEIRDITKKFGFFRAEEIDTFNSIDKNANGDRASQLSIRDTVHHWKVTQQQTGVVRTNCKDNVDRTSLVQTYWTLQTIWEQLHAVGINIDNVAGEERQKLEQSIRQMCADNNDAISLQYTGTKSMRSGVIRGRTSLFERILNDLQYAFLRYFFALYHDGPKQDAIDLLRKEFIVGVHDIKYNVDNSSSNNSNKNNNTNNNNTDVNIVVKGNDRTLGRGVRECITRIIVALLMFFRPSTMWVATSYFGIVYGLSWTFCMLAIWRVLRLPHRLFVVRPALRKQQPRRFQ
jgi:hypothetical protein